MVLQTKYMAFAELGWGLAALRMTNIGEV